MRSYIITTVLHLTSDVDFDEQTALLIVREALENHITEGGDRYKILSTTIHDAFGHVESEEDSDDNA